MENSGRALMGIGTAEEENRAVRAAQEAIVCPLLENSSIDGALGVIVNVKGGCDIGMREVLDAVSTVKKAAHPEANIIFGAVVDEVERPELQVTVIAAGFAKVGAEPREVQVPQVETGKPEQTVSEPPAATGEGAQPEQPAAQDAKPDEKEQEKKQGQISLFNDEEAKNVPPLVPRSPKEEEDLGIPAFLRKRKEKKKPT